MVLIGMQNATKGYFKRYYFINHPALSCIAAQIRSFVKIAAQDGKNALILLKACRRLSMTFVIS
jgi:hypothetical protein